MSTLLGLLIPVLSNGFTSLNTTTSSPAVGTGSMVTSEQAKMSALPLTVAQTLKVAGVGTASGAV